MSGEKTRGKEESSGKMGTVEGKKQEKRRAPLEAANELFLEQGCRKTSVEDITSRAKVQRALLSVFSGQGCGDAGAAGAGELPVAEQRVRSGGKRQTELETFPDKMVAVIDHIIEALRKGHAGAQVSGAQLLWPGLDQIEPAAKPSR